MTTVEYECIAENGEKSICKTLPEAKSFVEKNGGTYKKIESYSETYSATFVRRNARWRQ